MLDNWVGTSRNSTNPLTGRLPTQYERRHKMCERALDNCGCGQDVDKEEASESRVIDTIDICFANKIAKSKLTVGGHSRSSLSCRRPFEVVIEKSALQLGCSRQCWEEWTYCGNTHGVCYRVNMWKHPWNESNLCCFCRRFGSYSLSLRKYSFLWWCGVTNTSIILFLDVPYFRWEPHSMYPCHSTRHHLGRNVHNIPNRTSPSFHLQF